MENMFFDCFEEQKALTEELVRVNSVVGSSGGETAMAEFIYGKLAGWEYFRDHPENLFLVPTEDDATERSSVVALVMPEADEETSDAVMLMGHIDTVEISDYGVLEPLATRPAELQEAMTEVCSDPEALEDINSGKYMFGRGALDMKAGVACYMKVLKHFSEDRSVLRGALIALFECDEEGDSHGMLTSVRFIRDLAAERGLRIRAALCSDYSSKEAAVYLGTIGKYLPCIMAFGRSSHVGQVFSSVDPNLIIAEITSATDYNTDFCEQNLGEMTQPPVTLKQTDTKNTYSVQTADSAYVYFNWFALKKTEEEILSTCRDIAAAAAERVTGRINRAKASYAEKLAEAGHHPVDPSLVPVDAPRVLTLAEYAAALGEEMRRPDPSEDIRQFWISEASRLRSMDPDMSPVVLVFMAGISYPPVTVDPGSELGIAASGLGIPVRTYYPFISDASFVSMLGDVPLANLGTFGRDAHMYTERVDMDYSFRRLPNLTWDLILKLIGK